ncbi:MAG: hypothetical protein JSS31_11665 [Proteobacteria bacterium]|nr:hypothetical protein [Pseudomonadota bacterium]MBS0494588.1 hypothetical protein [Pseudomonadota bacterium]
MKFNPFEEITKPWSQVTLHNVHLLAVCPTEDLRTMITVEYQGAKCDLISAGHWDAQWSPRDVGRFGYLVPADPIDSVSQWACRFRTYLDPSLRRLFELDAKDQWGWLCDDRPQGFLAPAGLLPGVKGRYVADETIPLTLRIPPEFVRLCRGVDRTPAEVLRGFVADAGNINNYCNWPRADGYDSNGSDERYMAEEWLKRAYGIDAVDVEQLEIAEEARAARADARDEFGVLLEEFLDYSGSVQKLHDAVNALIEQQRLKQEATTGEQ